MAACDKPVIKRTVGRTFRFGRVKAPKSARQSAAVETLLRLPDRRILCIRQRHGFGLCQSPVSIYDCTEKLKIRNDDVAAGEQGDDLLFFELAELSAHRFERKAKVVRHLGPREGQLKGHIIPLKGAFSGNAPRHHEEEARDALVGALVPRALRRLAFAISRQTNWNAIGCVSAEVASPASSLFFAFFL